jgi:hypothetical protein
MLFHERNNGVGGTVCLTFNGGPTLLIWSGKDGVIGLRLVDKEAEHSVEQVDRGQPSKNCRVVKNGAASLHQGRR